MCYSLQEIRSTEQLKTVINQRSFRDIQVRILDIAFFAVKIQIHRLIHLLWFQQTVTYFFVSLAKCKPQQAASRADLSSLCALLLRTLESRQLEALGHSLTHILPVLNSVLTHSPECLTEGSNKFSSTAKVKSLNTEENL